MENSLRHNMIESWAYYRPSKNLIERDGNNKFVTHTIGYLWRDSSIVDCIITTIKVMKNVHVGPT